MIEQLNAIDELYSRDDFAAVLLESYKNKSLLEISDPVTDDGRSAAIKIINEEIFMARNEVYEQMTDEMREETLNAVLDNQRLIESGNYYYGIYETSCFFSYVYELNETGDSEWYSYIDENHPVYLEYCRSWM